jgi:hypothetical protein
MLHGINDATSSEVEVNGEIWWRSGRPEATIVPMPKPMTRERPAVPQEPGIPVRPHRSISDPRDRAPMRRVLGQGQ